MPRVLVDAGISIGENFTEAIEEAGNIFTNAKDAIVEGFNDIDLAASISGAKAIEAAKKQAARLELEQQRLKEVAEFDAEIQRQIRDDVSETIDLRIKANEKLSEILEKQAEQEKASINQRIANLRLQNELLSETEDRNLEIIALTNELAEVDNRIAGQNSEQLTNTNALLQEKRDLLQSITDTELEAETIREQAAIDSMSVAIEQADAQIALDRKVYDAQRELINRRIEDAKEGTQAYADAVNERTLLDAEYFKTEQDQARERIALEKSVKDAKAQIGNQVLDLVQSLANEGSKIAKGAAVAQATINAYQGITSVLAAPSTIPEPFGSIAKGLSAAAIGVSAFKNVKKILSVKPGGGNSVPSSSSGSDSGPAAPAVGQAIGLVNPNNGAQNIGDQIQQGFQGSNMRAYVVGSDVSGQQQVDREIAQNGTFG